MNPNKIQNNIRYTRIKLGLTLNNNIKNPFKKFRLQKTPCELNSEAVALIQANKISIENQTESNAEVFALNSSKQYNPDSKPVNTNNAKKLTLKLYRNLLVKQQTTAPKLIENNLLIILILTLINYIQK